MTSLRAIDYNGHVPAEDSMTEAQLLAEVTAAADRRGLLWHHCPDSRRCKGRRGFPDLVLLGCEVLFAELKGEDGETSADQDGWLSALHDACVPWAVWHPADWRSGRIQAELDKLG